MLFGLIGLAVVYHSFSGLTNDKSSHIELDGITVTASFDLK